MACHPFARALAYGLACTLCLPAPPAWAGPAADLGDLVDAKGAGGEAELERRGYTHIDTSKSTDASFSYWWNNAKASCVRVTTRDGRYKALVDVDPSDCGQTKKEGGLSDGAKVAIGAAALLGIAALAHKSHHRDDRNYDVDQTADFERGYRDGLYNNSYHNYGNNREYSDGYNQGVNERSQQSSYRNGNYSRGGYGAYARVSDLAGRDANDVWRQLERRGFQSSGDRNMGRGRSQVFYWNNRTGQCVGVNVRDNWVDSVSEVGRYSCNR